MNYWLLKQKIKDPDKRKRVVGHLVALREQLSRDLPAKDAEDNLLLATWNIRDLGKENGWGYGPRLPESSFYIAEILSRFDFVAVQEVNQLDPVGELIEILGPSWDYLASDVTDPKLGGNGERLTYLFDRRKVWFRNIAGEIVLPPAMLVSENVVERAVDQPSAPELQNAPAGRQFARTPYVGSFQAGWLKFDICTVHLYYGAESGSGLQRRISEIRQIAHYFGTRAEDALADSKALILLGDFNIVEPEHMTMKALLESGFEVPDVLRNPTNIGQDKYYDQIAFKTRPGVIDYLGSSDRRRAGTIDIFERLFTPDQLPEYEDAASVPKNAAEARAREAAEKAGKTAPQPAPMDDYYLDWRTWQLSDHRPMWVQLQANDSAAYLEKNVLEG
jgi:hypothetical protein